MKYRIVPIHLWEVDTLWELQRKRLFWWCWVTVGSKGHCEQVYKHLLKPVVELYPTSRGIPYE